MITNKIIYLTAQILRIIGFNFNEMKDKRVAEMRNKLRQSGGIEFKIEFYPNGIWTAESTNIDGIITGGGNPKKIKAILKDAIFTYFEIPPYLCNDNLIKADNEPVIVKQKVYA